MSNSPQEYDPLQSFAVASGVVSKPGGDAVGQDALHIAEALVCLLQHCICVSRHLWSG